MTNGKYYVGSSKNIVNRLKQHRYQLSHDCHKNTMQTDWNKGDVFEHIVVESITMDDAEQLLQRYRTMKPMCRVDHYLNNNMILPAILLIAEQRYLTVAKEHPETNYQQCYVADGGELTDQTKKKISDSLKGRTFSDVHRKKISLGNSNRIITDITKKKIGEYSKLRRHTESTKSKISSAAQHIDHDKTEYQFTNVKSGDIFVGTRNQFRKKYEYSHSGVRKIIRGKYKTYPVWVAESLPAVNAIH